MPFYEKFKDLDSCLLNVIRKDLIRKLMNETKELTEPTNVVITIITKYVVSQNIP